MVKFLLTKTFVERHFNSFISNINKSALVDHTMTENLDHRLGGSENHWQRTKYINTTDEGSHLGWAMTSYPTCIITSFINNTNEVNESLQVEEKPQFGYEFFMFIDDIG